MARTPTASHPPRTPDEILDLLEAGRLSPADAFARFRELEAGEVTRLPREDRDGQADRAARLAEVMAELDGLVGLTSVKKLVREVQAFVSIQRRRAQERLIAEPLVLHMVFKGNPGTGKTTVARILGKMFREMGVLAKGQLVEVERADLVGEYIGHTAQKTRDQLKRAMGGILFIDEAYSLARGGEKDFGKEAIDALVKSMEDHKDELILILAGYPREMEFFLRTNPGLRSRFPIHIDFPDYDPAELLQIAQIMCRQRQYKLSPAAQRRLMRVVSTGGSDLIGGDDAHNAGNARLVRNLIEQAIRCQALRLVRRRTLTREDLMLIEAHDLPEAPAG